jgi:TrmH family RNA methyltransferase
MLRTPRDITIVLDAINDPGNLGTIIRLCDWFGIANIVCSEDTVDVYNPKVLQSTMGSFTRVQVYYFSIVEFLKKHNTQPILGTFMEGNSVYESEFPENGFLVLGNEANGISNEVEKLITLKVSIPKFSQHQKTESLNVAMATSIFLSEYARKKLSGM